MKKIIKTYFAILFLQCTILGLLGILRKDIYLYIVSFLLIFYLCYGISKYIFLVNINKKTYVEMKNILEKNEKKIKDFRLNILNVEHICDVICTYDCIDTKINKVIDTIKIKGRKKNKMLFDYGLLPVVLSFVIYIILSFDMKITALRMIKISQGLIACIYYFIIIEYYSKVVLKKIAIVNRKLKVK